jgi:alkylation response protein AidB-like acyl-CoA dehydrogenase
MFVALAHGGPTLIMKGSEEQKKFHLPKILRGEGAWSQGFSEPGSGSDLASLKTRAVIDGDHLVVNGQKIWSSYARYSDYQELLVRTDPTAPPHKGISWVICDMNTPGIEIRPILNLAGEEHFTQIFYDDVRIPIANVVGRLNDGWSVAMSTLSFERGTGMVSHQMSLAKDVEKLIEIAHERPGPDGDRPAIKDDELMARLMMARSEVAALRAMTYGQISRGLRDFQPGAEGNIIALYFGELIQKVTTLAVDLLGSELLDYEGPLHEWGMRYLEAFKWTIAGGTSEIRRNVIGERVLNLPRIKGG